MALRAIGMLLCALLMGTARANAPAMKCVELPSSSVLCDDQERIYYRPHGAEQFIALDRETVYTILESVSRQRRQGVPADPAVAAQREA
jgi:hypothetical protein